MNLNLPAASVPSPKGDEIPFTPNTQLAKVAFGLALLTFFIYLPVIGYTFVNYDDDVFVTYNKMVAPGFTWEGVKWAFTSAEIDYWRPLSWLSHMLDMELFGAVGGLHHLTSLLIHMAATVMLLLALHRLTKELWPSAMVAALFAWHPLHVESVAWIAERKDVLCGFFWYFSMWAYARYVSTGKARDYALMLTGFGLGAMSKPMIITLPFALLLLDFWPLRRHSFPKQPLGTGAFWLGMGKQCWPLVREKLPLFAAVGVIVATTIVAQREVGTMAETLPLWLRINNSLLAYAIYLGQTVWPAGLNVLYPLNLHPVWWHCAGAGLLLAGATVACLMQLQRRPYLAFGWFFFLGVLVPTIGLIQVGEQGHADRYTYVPLLGVFMMAVWGVGSQTESRPSLRRNLPYVAGIALVGCAVLTRSQISYWEDDLTLFRRAVAINPKNVTALNNIASGLIGRNQYREAVTYLERALAIEPRKGTYWNLGIAYSAMRDYRRAYPILAKALAWDPFGREGNKLLAELTASVAEDPQQLEVQRILALAFAARKDFANASTHLAKVIALDPTDMDARVDRAAYLAALGQDMEALATLKEVVRLAPTNLLAQSNIGGLLAKQGHFEEALAHYRHVLATTPDNYVTRHNYALTLTRAGQVAEGKAEFEAVLRRQPFAPSMERLAWLLATRETFRNGPEAVRLAEKAVQLSPQQTPSLLDTAAAAYAANGQFILAEEFGQRALTLARKSNLSALAALIQARLEVYHAHKPYTQSD